MLTPSDSEKISLESLDTEALIKSEISHKSLIGHILTNLIFGQDLTKVLIPVFFLEPRSLLERYTELNAHPQHILNIAEVSDPVERMKTILRWHLSGWHNQPPGVKKPYNPLLGEVFFAFWEHDDSQTEFLAEQVSHHPPVSAIFLENRKKGWYMTASIHTQSKFLGNTAASIPVGEGHLCLTKLGETYSMTYPTIYACGLFVGSFRMELGGKCYIKCPQTNLTTEIEFLSSSLLSGSNSRNRVRGNIKDGKTILYNFEGKWDSEIYFSVPKNKNKELFLDVTKAYRAPGFVMPLADQGEWESRHAWKELTDSLRKGDMEGAEKAKFINEEAQRDRKTKRTKGLMAPHEPKFFKCGGDIKTWNYKFLKDGNKASVDRPKELTNLLKRRDDQNETLWKHIREKLKIGGDTV